MARIKVDFNQFKEMVRIDHCNGEITEEKLLAFLCNFNKNRRLLRPRVILENGSAMFFNGVLGMLPTVLSENDFDNKIDFLLNVLLQTLIVFPKVMRGR